MIAGIDVSGTVLTDMTGQMDFSRAPIIPTVFSECFVQFH